VYFGLRAVRFKVPTWARSCSTFAQCSTFGRHDHLAAERAQLKTAPGGKSWDRLGPRWDYELTDPRLCELTTMREYV
jgi:hypothetical protein